MPLLDEPELRDRVARLAAIERPSGSEGERRAARLIAAELEAAGAAVELEQVSVHGTYWWPVGLPAAAAALAGRRRGGRLAAVAAGALGAVAVADDVTGGRQALRRALLPHRRSENVVARIGDEDAPRTVVVVAHHDAAHAGLVFHPDLARAALRRFPALAERAKTTPPTMWGAVAGPALVALGALAGRRGLRRAGTLLSAGYAAAMADIGLRGVVPGANDNLTGVAVLLSLAADLGAEPEPGVRVILLSCASEESFMEGMQAFARRHFDALDPASTTFVNLDTVGSPHLVALEGEGMLWMNEYPKDLLALVAREAEAAEVPLVPELRFRNATDGLIPLRAGFATVSLVSVDDLKIPSNYHWPTDTADRVDYATVAGAARLTRRLITAIRRA